MKGLGLYSGFRVFGLYSGFRVFGLYTGFRVLGLYSGSRVLWRSATSTATLIAIAVFVVLLSPLLTFKLLF